MNLDTGPLVALLNRGDNNHQWANGVWQIITPPLFTCDAVLVEDFFLLRNQRRIDDIFTFITRGAIELPFSLKDEYPSVQKLMTQYASVPMSLADACLVRMSELYPDSPILTLDSDFTIYRKNRNQPIPVIMP